MIHMMEYHDIDDGIDDGNSGNNGFVIDEHDDSHYSDNFDSSINNNFTTNTHGDVVFLDDAMTSHSYNRSSAVRHRKC